MKTAFEQINLAPDSIWTHLLRKSFRKTLYKGGVEPDVGEVLMGHKLSGSRTAYFDNNDSEFLSEQYSSVKWDRYPIKELEETVTKLEVNGKSKDEKIAELEKQLAYFKSPDFANDVVVRLKEIGTPFDILPPNGKPKKLLQKS